MIAPAPLLILAALIGQADDAADPAAERLEFMTRSMAGYDFRRPDGTPLRMADGPAFRLGEQGNGILEGAIYFWLDEVGRPEVAAQTFLHRIAGEPEGVWVHEFSSLSTGTFTADQAGRTRWTPAEPGVEFRPVPGAPRPADGEASRSRQLRALAREFSARDDFGNAGWIDLRLLPTPIARYGREGAAVADGAVFAFVVGTDPEVLLFLESREGASGREWQYALAPMTCWPLRVERGGVEVWSLPLRSTDDPNRPFFSRYDRTEP